jgi:hypothetical protein
MATDLGWLSVLPSGGNTEEGGVEVNRDGSAVEDLHEVARDEGDEEEHRSANDPPSQYRPQLAGIAGDVRREDAGVKCQDGEFDQPQEG